MPPRSARRPPTRPRSCAELIAAGLLIATGVPGRLRPRRGVRGRPRRASTRCSPREAGARGAERLRFPPLLPRRAARDERLPAARSRTCAGSVFAFEGDEARGRDAERARRPRTRTGASSSR